MSMHHVIIGGGPAATGAAETIREFDAQARVTLVSDEPAHSRMALPYWLSGQIPREQTLTADANYLQQSLAVESRLGVRATRLDRQQKAVELSDGSRLGFDRLLIATGSSPAPLTTPGSDLPGVTPLWTLDHTAQLLEAAERLERRPSVVMIGAGFIGFIVLNAMYKRGWQLAVVERQDQLLPRMLDPGAAGLVRRWLDQRSVATYCEQTVDAIRPAADGRKLLQLSGGQTLEADLVIVAVGIRPNLELAADAGIATDQGILVDDRMETSVEGIFAAGDVAQGPVLYAAERAVHAIQPTAVDHGRVAGANMAGAEIHYPGSLAMNVVDVCGLQCASFGDWADASAEAIVIANEQDFVYRKLLCRGDQLLGAIFAGRAQDLGMLTDVGMVKGILQSRTPLGPWMKYLRENPFDVRRAYIGAGVAQRLAQSTLLGRPFRGRRYRFGDPPVATPVTAAHAAYVGPTAAGGNRDTTAE